MPWFSSSSPFDADVERATDKNNTTENWALMMDLCDKVGNTPVSCKDCLRSISKRLHSEVPHVQKQALTLLDACISNCGKAFHLEVASRDFEPEIRRLITKCHPGIADKTKALLKKWAEGEFKSDPQLNLIPSLYNKLRQSGIDFSSVEDAKVRRDTTSKSSKASSALAASQKEADDLAKAIELSLQESKKGSSGGPTVLDSLKTQPTSLYPTAKIGSAPASSHKEPRMVRALYDFEAAEDNELTFYTGEIIHVLDDSDANWWKGSNQRGEGLFPANFVTSDLSERVSNEKESPSARKVQFRDSVEVRTVETEEEEEEEEDERTKQVQIDEEKMRLALKLIHEGDPTGAAPDPPELAVLEGQCLAMGPLIDAELEKIDKKHAVLSRLSTDLVEALNLYHTLMRSSYSTEGMVNMHSQPYMQPGIAPSPPMSVIPGQTHTPVSIPAGHYASPGLPGPQPVYHPYGAPQYQMPAPVAISHEMQHVPVQQQYPPAVAPGYPMYHPQYAAPAQPVASAGPVAPYYGGPHPQAAVAPAPYYPGYPSQTYDPTKMMGMDPNQAPGASYVSASMPSYDPNMAGRGGHPVGLEESFATMTVNSGDGQGHHVNSMTNAGSGHQQPLL